ncbi:hypothetical protein JP75_05805 [Devosia riboflavina]|uniref:DUF2059 domain-containing protein n=1 Tax=Devosia riboflavina TaxID=46914 RepID=A0A087M4W3_9HYPH|nr:hypothetical protein [Devosia riboflavina]KFL31916.1 hypothetical protein JP75_05805 [Devosia riboflavina]
MKFGIFLVAAGLMMATPAMALTVGEAEAVVGIVEQLADETGEGMVADAAEIFFDYDALGANLIPAAGFDRASWVTAYDAVASGYMAVIPLDEFNAVFEEPLALLEASALADDQKAMMREHIVGLVAEAQATREQGMVHADIVRPLEGRLHALFFGEFGE